MQETTLTSVCFYSLEREDDETGRNTTKYVFILEPCVPRASLGLNNGQ